VATLNCYRRSHSAYFHGLVVAQTGAMDKASFGWGRGGFARAGPGFTRGARS
jgi:hypothetical protein